MFWFKIIRNNLFGWDWKESANENVLDENQQKQRGKQNENLNMVLRDYGTKVGLELHMKVAEDKKKL